MVRRYGGEPGIRDLGALESAVGTPQAGSVEGYLHEDLQAMAAAYLFHLTQGHPFVDGNKRTGAATADVFLDLNGIELTAGEDDYEAVVRRVAEGQLNKSGLGDFLRAHSRVRRITRARGGPSST